MGWSDVGSWDALWQIAPKDNEGNAVQGDVIAVDTRNSLLRTDPNVTLAAVGVEDMVVVATRDAILVAPRARAQDTKKVVEALEQAGRDDHREPAKVHRPWGSYETTDSGARFQTKRIVVKPGHKLSLQMHHHRSEHWIVVTGTARVTIGDEVRLLQENQSTYIPAGTAHRLENPGKIPLHMIEVQCGAYLGEDDIVRFEDSYGRG
jgi:mannose-1-phosphate guanylyltransferase/mannose-6-phosphate isomerase